jgi:hypothetical protein
MTSKNNNSIKKILKKVEKKTWVQPMIAEINVSAVKQQEEELYLKMLADPEIFRLIEDSGPTRLSTQ